ncbi:ABC transporter ATP-binding protein [Arsenicitalea aurantiaca]|uniref:Glutathione import ATP-binding protein GsiA n=1 Tax=Arsenicitalea aurantiaca TaxID=1783274 RepID=A0A433X7Q6_9HYPH|nr:ABC transporter ATP-binding protein [Arsenicitalea aurantiaca]RUT30106.1 ABC transporter ATP-binding protein [Arsenicitalea aurantiaca]
MSPEPVLLVEDLRVAFGRTEVVKGVSFRLDAGKTLALVGESGSGKSVTALSIMRLLPERARVTGAIRLGETDMLALSGEALRKARGKKAGMIFQEPMTSLNPVLRVGEQVAEALHYHTDLSKSAARAEVLRLFERVRIPDAARRYDEYPHTFSGGMRQRVMIAMALACKPRLLIADEPTTALDVTIQAEILDLLAELQRETGTAVLFITHDMGVVAEIADDVLVMRHGDILEQGPVRKIFSAPAHDYTRDLLAAVPRLGDMAETDRPVRFRPRPAEQIPASPRRDPAPTPDAEPLLSVDGLVTRFKVRGGMLGRHTGNVHAVEGVSFALRRGETLALVGESGCGKSTTGRSILRLVEPEAGAVRFDGQDVLKAEGQALRTIRQRIQMIFQDPYGSLDPRQTVGSAIAEPMHVHKIARGSEMEDRVASLLRRVELDPGSATRFPHEFSGGQRQRICIARALALDPALVIADEAVSALDVSIKAQVTDLLLDLQDDLGLSYLFISHDMAVVERISHRIAVMHLGRIVETGPRSAVIGSPSHPYTQKLLAAVPVADPEKRRARKRDGVAEELRSPIRSVGFKPEDAVYREVGPGHFVMEGA